MILVKELSEQLTSIGAKVSTAESFTSGFVSKTLTSIPGSSNYFEGSLVVYSNKSKINILGIEKELIETYSEVSDNVACRMAEKIKEIMETEYSIATTGYADINGYGTKENPAGTVYIAVSTPNETIVRRLELKSSRSKNIYKATVESIKMLSMAIKNHQAL